MFLPQICYNNVNINALRDVQPSEGSMLKGLAHMPIIPLAKRCSKCGIEYPLTSEYFHKDSSSKTGLHSNCKECVRAYSREYVATHGEEHRQYQRDYNKKNPEKIKANNAKKAPTRREYNSKRRAADPEKARLHDRIRYANSREQSIARSLRYQKRHPEIRQFHERKRRARKANAEGFFTKSDVDLLYKSQKAKCWHCGKSIVNGYHIDHLIPLARGGTNWPNNLVLSCPTCNLSKGAKLTQEWNGKLF